MINIKIQPHRVVSLQARLPHGSFRLPHVVIPVPVPAPGSRSDGVEKQIVWWFWEQIQRKELKGVEVKAGIPPKKPRTLMKSVMVSMSFSIIASDVSWLSWSNRHLWSIAVWLWPFWDVRNSGNQSYEFPLHMHWTTVHGITNLPIKTWQSSSCKFLEKPMILEV